MENMCKNDVFSNKSEYISVKNWSLIEYSLQEAKTMPPSEILAQYAGNIWGIKLRSFVWTYWLSLNSGYSRGLGHRNM